MSHIHIEVKDLTFAYEKDRRILDGLTFTAREKDAIGIIGEPAPLPFGDKVVGIVMNRNGSVQDVIMNIKE